MKGLLSPARFFQSTSVSIPKNGGQLQSAGALKFGARADHSPVVSLCRLQRVTQLANR